MGDNISSPSILHKLLASVFGFVLVIVIGFLGEIMFQVMLAIEIGSLLMLAGTTAYEIAMGPRNLRKALLNGSGLLVAVVLIIGV